MLRIFALLSLFFPFAFAEEEVDLSDTISGKKAPILKIKDKTEEITDIYEDGHSRKYPDRFYEGARILNMSPEFVWGCWKIMEGLYKRDLKNHHGVMAEMERKFPGSGVAPTGRALMWQVLMLENFDFEYEKQYKNAFEIARQELTNSMYIAGNEAWETFLMGAILGVDGIHMMRKEEWLAAINRGFEGVSTIERAKKLAPGFIDAELGDGLWYYWRSLIAMNIPGIKPYKDQRKEGIKLMQNAERNSVFIRPAASHALTYIWIEEGKVQRAISTAKRLRKKYPDNIINLQILGRALMYRKKYDESEKVYLDVLRVDPKNKRAHYYMARLFLKQKKYEKAEKKMKHYLSFNLEKVQQAWAHHYLGHIYRKQKKYKLASEYFTKAWKVTKNARSKKRAKEMRIKSLKK